MRNDSSGKKFSATLDEIARNGNILDVILPRELIICRLYDMEKIGDDTHNVYGLLLSDIPQQVKNKLGGNITRCIIGRLKRTGVPLSNYLTEPAEYRIFAAEGFSPIPYLVDGYYMQDRARFKDALLTTILIKQDNPTNSNSMKLRKAAMEGYEL